MRLMAGASPTRTHQLLEHSLRRRTPQSSKQGGPWDPLPVGLGGGIAAGCSVFHMSEAQDNEFLSDYGSGQCFFHALYKPASLSCQLWAGGAGQTGWKTFTLVQPCMCKMAGWSSGRSCKGRSLKGGEPRDMVLIIKSLGGVRKWADVCASAGMSLRK